MSAKDGKTQLLDNAKCKKVKGGAFCKSLMGITMKKIVNKSCAAWISWHTFVRFCQMNKKDKQAPNCIVPMYGWVYLSEIWTRDLNDYGINVVTTAPFPHCRNLV